MRLDESEAGQIDRRAVAGEQTFLAREQLVDSKQRIAVNVDGHRSPKRGVVAPASRQFGDERRESRESRRTLDPPGRARIERSQRGIIRGCPRCRPARCPCVRRQVGVLAIDAQVERAILVGDHRDDRAENEFSLRRAVA